MAAFSAEMTRRILDWTLGGSSPTQPPNRWLGLAAGTPTSVSGSELTQAQGYFSRLTALFGAATSPAGSASNTAGMTFGPFSSGASALGCHLWDGSPISSSTMLAYGTLQTARTYGIGDSLVFAPGALIITLV